MKKVLFFILSFFLLIGICSADVKTYDRNVLDNYGVNKNINIDKYNIDDILKTHAVDANQKIYDFSNLLSESDEYYLKQLVDDFYKNTGFDLIILTESFYNVDDDDNGDYAQNFYDYNDFGMNDKYYSGVVIFRNDYPNAKYYGVYSFGEAQYYYPAEYSDNRLNYTLDDVYYDMYYGNYKVAMAQIISDLTNYYYQGKENGMEDYILDSDGVLIYNPTFNPPIVFSLIVSLIVAFAIVYSNVQKNKTVFLPRLAHDYLDKKSLVYSQKSDILYNSRTTHYTYSSSRSSGGYSGGRRYSSSRGSSSRGRSGGGRRG